MLNIGFAFRGCSSPSGRADSPFGSFRWSLRRVLIISIPGKGLSLRVVDDVRTGRRRHSFQSRVTFR